MFLSLVLTTLVLVNFSLLLLLLLFLFEASMLSSTAGTSQRDEPTISCLGDVRKLIPYLPQSHQGPITTRIAEAQKLYVEDRHFEVVEWLDAMREDLVELADSLLQSPSSPVTIIAASALPGGGAVDAVPPTASPYGVKMIAKAIHESVEYGTSLTKKMAGKKFLHDVKTLGLWTPVNVDKATGHGTYCRDEPNSASMSFLVVGFVDVPMVNMASVIMELDMYKEWFPLCVESEDLGIVSRFHRSSKFAIMLPFPVSNREVFITGYAIDDLTKHKRVIVMAKSVQDGDVIPDIVRRPPVTKGNVRADLKVGGFLIELVSETKCEVSFIMNVDPHLMHVPSAVTNFVSGRLMWVLLRQMAVAAKGSLKPTSKYAERRKTYKEIYDYFEQRAEEVLDLHFRSNRATAGSEPRRVGSQPA